MKTFSFFCTFIVDGFYFITEIQQEGCPDSQSAGGAESQPQSGSLSKWSHGPNVDGGQA